MVRLPGAYRTLSALAWRFLDPRSRLRRGLLRRALISGYAAASRRDYDLMLVRYAGDVEVEFDPDFAPLGLSGKYRGHDGFLKMIEAFGEAWEEWEVMPVAVVDLGDRGLALGHFHLPATASGLELAREFAQLITPRRGLVAYERTFLSWNRALQAAGLAPDSVTLLSRGRTGQAATGAA
jgi:ketosteroid isomerase-like protein